MKEKKIFDSITHFSVSSGLTSAQQLTDVTSNEIFSISQGTSATEQLGIVQMPLDEFVKIPENTEKIKDESFFGENIKEAKRVLKELFK